MSTSSWLSGKAIGRYRVGPLLGRGGMGEVYRAEDVELQRPVALKVLPEALVGDADRLSRFIQEARTASALNHPHLVSIYEIGEATPDGVGRKVHFIAMELVRGETLRQLFDSRRLDLKRTIDYLTQAADALAAAHAAGIIHRDLKPENLMAGDGYAKVLDFGLAKLRKESPLTAPAADDATVTQLPGGSGTAPGVVMGTVGYMSPEQAQGLALDHRSDIFSFGCILYEATTGARPFTGSSAVDTLHKIIHVQPPPLTQLAPAAPTELQRIVRKCLAKSPDERYQSMKDLALDLRDLRRELDSGSAPAAGSGAAPAAAPRSRSVLIATAAIVVVALIAAAAWALRPHGETTPATGGLSFERITSSGNVIDAIITPDAKYIAYVESGGGLQTLWIRQTRGGRPLQLAESKGGFWGITFSPDTTSIYYAIKSQEEPGGYLYNVDVLGGPAKTVLTGIDSPVTFSPDGSRFAFYRVHPHGSSSIMLAGAGGESPTALVTRRAPEFFAPGFFVAPSWSPDGRHIAAAVRNSKLRNAGVVLFNVADGSETAFPPVFAAATFVRWLPDGSGIIISGRTPGMYSSGNGGQLYVQPYPSGELRRITSDMLEYRNASVTADGKAILSVTFEASTRLSIMPVGGGEERRLPELRTAGSSGVAWSPTEPRIFYIKVVGAELQIWTMGSDGAEPREVIAKVQPAGLALSPDGTSIFYSAERDGVVGIWRARTDGSDPRLLAAVDEPLWITIAPDGRTLYFTSSTAGTPASYRLSTDGGEPVLVAPLFERATPSRDGRLLAGIYRASVQAPLTLGILDAASGKPVNIITDYAPAAGSGGFAWTPDDKSVLFTTTERFNLFKQPVMGGTREKMTNFTDLWVARFALSPDGTTILFARGTALRDAVLISNYR